MTKNSHLPCPMCGEDVPFTVYYVPQTRLDPEDWSIDIPESCGCEWTDEQNEAFIESAFENYGK